MRQAGRQALTALHSTPLNAEGKLFGIAIFDLISKWPLRLISPALLLLLCCACPLPSHLFPLLSSALCVCQGNTYRAQMQPAAVGGCRLHEQIAAGRVLRRHGECGVVGWGEVQRGRQTWHTQQVFRFMFLRLDCSQNTNAARRSCCCCSSCCSCSRRFTLGVFIQNV